MHKVLLDEFHLLFVEYQQGTLKHPFIFWNCDEKKECFEESHEEVRMFRT